MIQNSSNHFSLQALADLCGAKVKGNPDFSILGLCTLKNVKAQHLCFIRDKKAAAKIDVFSDDVAFIVTNDMAERVEHGLIVNHPELAFALIADVFAYKPLRKPSVHKSAVVAKTAHVPACAFIGPNVIIGEHVSLGAGAIIEAGCVIGDDVVIGERANIKANVTIYHQCQIGDRVTIHSGAVIGSDGFGNVMNELHQWQTIPQLGRVVIGDDVNIGANTTIDCGALDDTIIGNGVRIDNQIQIAHNVEIGDHSAIAGCVGIAGSAKLGKHCMIGGGCCIGGHIELCDGVILTGMSMVTRSIDKPGVYSSGTGLQSNTDWHKSVVRFRQLDDIAKRVKKLERTQ